MLSLFLSYYSLYSIFQKKKVNEKNFNYWYWSLWSVCIIKLIKENFIIDIVDGSENKIDKKLKWSTNYQDGLSPKYNSQSFFSENFFFKKKGKINLNNFFLSSTLSAGGGSKYWGSGLEIPDKYYYQRNKLKFNQFKNQIENSKIFFDLKNNKVLSKKVNVEQKFFKKFLKILMI